jgi:hypothetical protein
VRGARGETALAAPPYTISDAFKLAGLARCRSGTTSNGASMRDVDAMNE